LCDMQTQDKRSYLGLDLGFFVNEYEFIPRIEYNDLILSEASWNIKKQDIAPLLKVSEEDNLLLLTIKDFRRNLKIPKLVTLVDGDNELLINFDNLLSIRIFLDTVKNRNSFKLSEFLFGENDIVKSDNGEHYIHQIILSFYNQNKIKND